MVSLSGGGVHAVKATSHTAAHEAVAGARYIPQATRAHRHTIRHAETYIAITNIYVTVRNFCVSVIQNSISSTDLYKWIGICSLNLQPVNLN